MVVSPEYRRAVDLVAILVQVTLVSLVSLVGGGECSLVVDVGWLLPVDSAKPLFVT